MSAIWVANATISNPPTEDEEKMKQEEASLRNIDDSFKKIIIVGEDTPVLRNEAGITTIGIYDFLLNENSLDL